MINDSDLYTWGILYVATWRKMLIRIKNSGELNIKLDTDEERGS